MPMDTKLTQLLCDLVALPSVNPESDQQRMEPPYGESRVADYVERYFQRLGVRTERQQAQPGRYNVLAHIPGADATAPPFLLEAHMDTIGAEGIERPFAPWVDEGRVYGRGACDTKGSLAAMMFTLRQVLEEGASLPRGCVLAATADEEFGMTGARRLLASEIDFSGAIVGEPTGLRIVPAHDGQLYVKIRATGEAAHTSMPQNGINAIYLIHDVIHALRRRASVVYGQRKHPLCGPPKLTVSIIHGGVSEHIVPDCCEIAIDCRVIPGETCQGMLEEVQGWLADDLPAAVLERIEVAAPHKAEPPMETPTDHPLVQGMRSAAAQVLGTAEIAGVPYNTDASHYGAAGLACVVFGPGDIAQAHSSVEFIEIEQLRAAAQILTQFLTQELASLP